MLVARTINQLVPRARLGARSYILHECRKRGEVLLSPPVTKLVGQPVGMHVLACAPVRVGEMKK